ncbi:hypothetical protein TNCV_1119271 [Trichonephila clavipes]|uniref:Uncharacterized protein n=1 Tax=Trichonephila clavipes TaxID=2585209 RepID=A0A8X6VS79_TRICX|nr:hypothetical protein TNCV_1119271 [Trichonephila clavipes]
MSDEKFLQYFAAHVGIGTVLCYPHKEDFAAVWHENVTAALGVFWELQRIGTAHSAGAYKKRFSIGWSNFLLHFDLRYLSESEKMPHRRIRAHYKQLSEIERCCIIGLKEAVFSDESRFQLCSDDHRRRVWRRPAQRADPDFTTVCHADPFSRHERPARIPDLSPIEHVLDMMGKRLHLPWNADDLAR